MINKLIIKDKSKLFRNYIQDLDLPEEISFKPGLNVLIGKNGCGKTTILNIIRRYTHCFKKYVSIPEIRDITDWQRKFQDGADLICDYNKPVFNLRTSEMLANKVSLESFQNFGQYYGSVNSSSGEDKFFVLSELFKIMFEEDHISNFNLLGKFDGEIQEYYQRNHIPSDSFTVLMDEPDTNLDVDHLSELYRVLSYEREDTQIITVLHNPALINKLDANFIELTPGYLEKIKDFVENEKIR